MCVCVCVYNVSERLEREDHCGSETNTRLVKNRKMAMADGEVRGC